MGPTLKSQQVTVWSRYTTYARSRKTIGQPIRPIRPWHGMHMVTNRTEQQGQELVIRSCHGQHRTTGSACMLALPMALGRYAVKCMPIAHDTTWLPEHSHTLYHLRGTPPPVHPQALTRDLAAVCALCCTSIPGCQYWRAATLLQQPGCLCHT